MTSMDRKEFLLNDWQRELLLRSLQRLDIERAKKLGIAYDPHAYIGKEGWDTGRATGIPGDLIIE